MKKIIICDKNQELITALKKIDFTNSEVDMEFVCGDVIELHEKTPNSRIVTASNPNFDSAGGLDAVLAEKYDWKNPREFEITDDLFFIISVDENIQTNRAVILRALVGIYGFSEKHTMIMTGIGTGIGGLDPQGFVKLIFDLCEADLCEVDLHGASLHGASLHGASLRWANLYGADLRGADLRGADLYRASLCGADLRGASLCGASLHGASLRWADLRGASLRRANLRRADLRRANLYEVDLCRANLCEAKNQNEAKYDETTAFFTLQCPEEGSFIGWKKAENDSIVKLLITENALRSSATTRKCRCSEAKVLEIWDKNGKNIKEIETSFYNSHLIYRVGETVRIEDFDENRWEECSMGIHFFITRREAEMY